VAHAWAAQVASNEEEPQKVPGIALLAPFIPPLLVILFNIQVITGFTFTILFVLIVCGRFKTMKSGAESIAKNAYDGVVDTAPLVCFMLFLGMFIRSASLSIPYFNLIFGNVIPRSPLVICIIFLLLSPLALFRGPFSLVGSGAALAGVLQGVGFRTAFLYPLFYTTTMTMNVSCCITQSWIMWGLNYTKVENNAYLKQSVPLGWIICAILAVVTYIVASPFAF